MLNDDGLNISWIAAFSIAMFAIMFSIEEDWDYKYRAEIVRVVDGDTVDTIVDLGFDIKLSARFRLYGIDAPEKKTEEGKASASRLTELLPKGSSVVIHTVKDRKEKFGRYLGSIFIDGKNVNKQMVLENKAKEYFP